MKSFSMEFSGDKIYIREYPDADQILTLPDDPLVKQHKDMTLHMMDLLDAKTCLELLNPGNLDVANRALVQNAIVVFYKCFGNNEFRTHSLNRDKVLATQPGEAKKAFDFYKTLRNKFIAHDGSRYANATTGAILDSSKERPLLDVVTAAWVADNYTSENGLAAMQTFYHLVLVTIEWVEAKIDELGRLLKKQYGDKPMSAFRDFPPLQVEVPTQEKLFEKRY